MPRLTTLVPLLLLTSIIGAGCSFQSNRYARIDNSLLAGDPKRADTILEQVKDEYGSNSTVLYGMDRGMTLQLAGDYARSNMFLEQAEREVDDLYTRRIRKETAAFFTNDSKLPYEGAPFEQVWINIIKALNYALLGNLDEALVEARRIDHRLNLLSDEKADSENYKADAFARYFSGILYEASGDLNNALVAYRNAYAAYQSTRSWSHTPIPSLLQADLLRLTDALHLRDEHQTYQMEFGTASWQRWDLVKDQAQIIVISFNGRSPRKENRFLDVPISLEALQLVLLNKVAQGGRSSREHRAFESVLYGLNGRVVRIALPELIPQKTGVISSTVTLNGTMESFRAETQLVSDLTASSKKALDDRTTSTAVKAVARAAAKFALAEGASYGARAAMGRNNRETGQVVGLIVGILGKIFAVASEEADLRSWRTLPDEIQIARLWVSPGTYELRIQPKGSGTSTHGLRSPKTISLHEGQVRFILDRVLM